MNGPTSKEDLLYLCFNFLREMHMTDAAKMIQQEMTMSLKFDSLKSMVVGGSWYELEDYISDYIETEMNNTKPEPMLIQIKKTKYIEAMIMEDFLEASDIMSDEIRDLTKQEEEIDTISAIGHSMMDEYATRKEDGIIAARSDLLKTLRETIRKPSNITNDKCFSHLKGFSLLQLSLRKLTINYRETAHRKRPANYSSSPRRIRSRFNPNEVEETETRIQVFVLPVEDVTDEQRVRRIAYLNTCGGIVALMSNSIHRVWKWEQHGSEKKGAKVVPSLFRPKCFYFMESDRYCSTRRDISSLSLTKNDYLLFSLASSSVFLFDLWSEKKKECQFPSGVTSFAFHPEDAAVVAIGRDDSTIQILNIENNKITELKGHTMRVTGLAFSGPLKMMFSSGSDNQIIAWDVENWSQTSGLSLEIPTDRKVSDLSKTEIEIDRDGMRVLVVHETQLAILDAKVLQKSFVRWIVGPKSSPLHSAAFSCNGELVFSSFRDGGLRVFSLASLGIEMIHTIPGSEYIPSFERPGWYQYEPVVAACPHEPSQFAVGLSNGKIIVIEPTRNFGGWRVQRNA